MTDNRVDPGYALALGDKIREAYQNAILCAVRGLGVESLDRMHAAETLLQELVYEAQASGL